MTFDRPALTGQGTDREVGVGGGAEMYQEAHGWGRHTQRPSQCSDQACHPSVTLSYGLTLRNTLGIWLQATDENISNTKVTWEEKKSLLKDMFFPILKRKSCKNSSRDIQAHQLIDSDVNVYIMILSSS